MLFGKALIFIYFIKYPCKLRVDVTLKAKHISSVFHGTVPRMQLQSNWLGIRVKRV